MNAQRRRLLRKCPPAAATARQRDCIYRFAPAVFESARAFHST